MTKRKIYVTEEHVKNGERYDPFGCPVAQAIREMFGIYPYVSTSTGSVFCLKQEGMVHDMEYFLDIPDWVVDKIKSYDRGDEDMLPFSFEVKLTPHTENTVSYVGLKGARSISGLMNYLSPDELVYPKRSSRKKKGQ